MMRACSVVARRIRYEIGHRFAWTDVRAGYIDARRTPNPKMWEGRWIGGLDYATGYAVGVLSCRA